MSQQQGPNDRTFFDAPIDLGPRIEVETASLSTSGETNSVWICSGRLDGRPWNGVVKVADRGSAAIESEHAVLESLAETDLPVPRVLRFRAEPTPCLVLYAREPRHHPTRTGTP